MIVVSVSDCRGVPHAWALGTEKTQCFDMTTSLIIVRPDMMKTFQTIILSDESSSAQIPK